MALFITQRVKYSNYKTTTYEVNIMSEQENKNNVIEGETADTTESQSTENTATKQQAKISNEVLTRIFVTLLFALIGWVSLWVFGVVVLVQFGFLLITGNLNKNLKAFNGELGDYLADIIKYVSFQNDDKPFPFQGWHYDDDKKVDSSEPAQQ